MPRNMSFSLTTQQVRDQTKTVTRRLGWKSLKKGDIINACVKCMGLKKGERVEVICEIRVVNVRREHLFYIKDEPHGTTQEGFPGMRHEEFITLFCNANKCTRSEMVTRIEFEYVVPKKVYPWDKPYGGMASYRYYRIGMTEEL